MSRVNDRLNELQLDMEGFVNDAKSRLDAFNLILKDMNQAVSNLNQEEENLNDETGKLTNEIKLLENKLLDIKSNLKIKNEKLAKLEPEIEDQNKSLETLQKSIKEAETKLSELKSNNSTRESKLNELTAESNEKELARNKLESSIDDKVTVNKQQLEDKKGELQILAEEYVIWDYLLSRIDQPEVEIMAIIASNRGNLASDDIKSRVKTVSPVFVGRAISKLEADEKIIQNEEGKWDIDQSLISVLE